MWTWHYVYPNIGAPVGPVYERGLVAPEPAGPDAQNVPIQRDGQGAAADYSMFALNNEARRLRDPKQAKVAPIGERRPFCPAELCQFPAELPDPMPLRGIRTTAGAEAIGFAYRLTSAKAEDITPRLSPPKEDGALGCTPTPRSGATVTGGAIGSFRVFCLGSVRGSRGAAPQLGDIVWENCLMELQEWLYDSGGESMLDGWARIFEDGLSVGSTMWAKNSSSNVTIPRDRLELCFYDQGESPPRLPDSLFV